METLYHVIKNGRRTTTDDPLGMLQAFDGRIVLDHYRGLLQLADIPQPPIKVGWSLNKALTQMLRHPGWTVYPSDLVRGSDREPMTAGSFRVNCCRLNKIFIGHLYGRMIRSGSYAQASVESDGSCGAYIDPDRCDLYLILGPVKPKPTLKRACVLSR